MTCIDCKRDVVVTVQQSAVIARGTKLERVATWHVCPGCWTTRGGATEQRAPRVGERS